MPFTFAGTAEKRKPVRGNCSSPHVLDDRDARAEQGGM